MDTVQGIATPQWCVAATECGEVHEFLRNDAIIFCKSSAHNKNYKVLGQNFLPKPNLSGHAYTFGGHSLYRTLPVYVGQGRRMDFESGKVRAWAISMLSPLRGQEACPP